MYVWNWIITATPGSPESPFWPRFPLFPGGPAGPEIRKSIGYICNWMQSSLKQSFSVIISEGGKQTVEDRHRLALLLQFGYSNRLAHHHHESWKRWGTAYSSSQASSSVAVDWLPKTFIGIQQVEMMDKDDECVGWKMIDTAESRVKMYMYRVQGTTEVGPGFWWKGLKTRYRVIAVTWAVIVMMKGPLLA